MSAATQYRKLYGLALLLGAALAALGFRLVDLQVVRHDEFQALAQQNTVRTFERMPIRGHILDCHGTPLAASQPAKVVCADPTLLGGLGLDVARALAPLLQTNESFLAGRLLPRLFVENGKTNSSKYVVLKRNVPIDTWDKIRQTISNLSFGVDESKLKQRDRAFYRNLRASAIFAEDDQIRSYPGHRLACHVVGFVESDDEHGVAGIESSFNSELAGVPGWRKTELDKRQRELVHYRDQDVAPRDGLNVVLTLDVGLQNIVEEELAAGVKEHSPISISCVAIRPRTGEILAMATLPNFDPNNPAAFSPDALRNRVISDVAEPGSTFKIVTVTAALNEHAVTLNDIFDCGGGKFYFAGRTLHDHGRGYGQLSVENIITKSSNIGAAKIALRLGDQTLWNYIHDFGFGQRTGVPLPGEVWGIVHPVNKWTKVSIVQIPMGQGIAVTPLQMAFAMSAIANKGILMRPMLVSRLEDAGGKLAVQYKPQPVRRVASLEAIAQMVTALKTVATREGTAAQARLEHYTVAGKTGTAEKIEHGQYVQKFFSSFIGFFPADNPEVCISVMMDEPKDGHYGGDVAAPVFHAIAERAANYLNLKPDIAPEPSPPQSITVAANGAHD